MIYLFLYQECGSLVLLDIRGSLRVFASQNEAGPVEIAVESIVLSVYLDQVSIAVARLV